MEGGTGNDTLVWNNGDGSDVMDGDAGNDGVEVNGSPTAGDDFTINPNGARVDFDRVNLGIFSLDIAAERLDGQRPRRRRHDDRRAPGSPRSSR